MSRLAEQIRDYLDGALPEGDLDEMLAGLARQVLDAARPLPGAPALGHAPGQPADAVAAGIVEEELDRVARLLDPAELERLYDQIALVLGGMPPREPDTLGPLRRPDHSGLMQRRAQVAGPELEEVSAPFAMLADRDEGLDALSLSDDVAPSAAPLADLDAVSFGEIAKDAPAPPPPPPEPPDAIEKLAAAAPKRAAPAAQAFKLEAGSPAPSVLGGAMPPPGASAPPPPPAPAPARPAARMRSTTSTPAMRPPAELTDAAIAPNIPASAPRAAGGGFHPPAVREPSEIVSAVVDLALPGGLALVVLRAIWLLATAGTPVGGTLAWLVAAVAYAGRAERLRGERGAGGSALGALCSALMFLLSLAK